MKKRAILRTVVFCALILLILLAMNSDHSYLVRFVSHIAEAEGDQSTYVYYPANFLSFFASIYLFASFALALLSLPLAVFSIRYRLCGRIGGTMLLLSAASLLYEDGRFGQFSLYDYTPLARCILAALILLGLWAVFAFRKKPQAQSAQASAEPAN